MLVIVRKSDNQPCGTIPSNMTAEQEILLNAIPNFGGSINDYEVQDIEPTPDEPTIQPMTDAERIVGLEIVIMGLMDAVMTVQMG